MAAALAMTQPAAEPVDLPSKEDLDAEVEAEIEAALSNDSPAAQVTVQTVDGEEEELTEETLEEGARLTGTVQSVDAENIFLDIGVRSPAIIQLRHIEAAKVPAVGDKLEVIVNRIDKAEGLVHVSLPDTKRRGGANWDSVKVGDVVEALVTKTNKGGLEISVSSIRGFLPASQIDVRFVSDMEAFVGQTLTVKITEVNPKRRNLIVSRRTLLEAERKEMEGEIWKELAVGQVRSGVVKTIKDYGAFVDIGGMDAFLHIGEISWSRIKHPTELMQEGETIEVQVLTIDQEKRRVGLGMRQLRQNPWQAAGEKFPPGSTATGKVTRTTNFGAFVELEPHVEGLVHISELEYRRVNQVTDVLNVGDVAEFQVLEVDINRKRIALSLKAMKEKPEEFKAPEPEPEEELPPQPRNENLRGGMGGGLGGSLFGNPDDYK